MKHKCYIMLELRILKELILMRKGNQNLSFLQNQKHDICHSWYFLNNGFKFQSNVCNECHNLLTMSIILSHTVILILDVLIIVVLLVKLAKLRPKS